MSASNRNDPILMLDGPLYRSTPARFLAQIGYIRKASEWRALGFAVEVHGLNVRPIVEDGLWFGFRRIGEWAKPIHVQAQLSNKRALHTYAEVDAFLMLGGRRDELLDLPEHIWAYNRAAQAEREGNLAEAIREITAAVGLDPEEVRYRECLYDWRLRARDVSAIADLMRFFENDVDSIVHSGLALSALRLAKEAQGVDAAESMYRALQDGLARMIGRPKVGRYSAQSPDFIAAKAEALAKEWHRVLRSRPKRRGKSSMTTSSPKMKGS